MKKKTKMDHHQDGVEAAFAGKKEEDCRFEDEEERSLWLDGFKAAIATIKRCCKGKKDDD